MESFFTRYRNLVVLAAVLVAQIMGLAMQVRRLGSGHNSADVRDGSGVRLIRLWAETAVWPFEWRWSARRLNFQPTSATAASCSPAAAR